MKLVKKTNKQTVKYSELKSGEVFKFTREADNFAMKVTHYALRAERVCAIWIDDGTPVPYIEDDKEVYRVKGSFIEE